MPQIFHCTFPYLFLNDVSTMFYAAGDIGTSNDVMQIQMDMYTKYGVNAKHYAACISIDNETHMINHVVTLPQK